MTTLLPEHEEFLLAHVKKMGFMLIVDCLKQKFPALTHDEACTVYDEFKAKYAEDDGVKKADAQLKGISKEIGGEMTKAITKAFRKSGGK